MSKRSKRLTFYGALLGMLACVTTAFFIARASLGSSSLGVLGKPQPRNLSRQRNLSLQPEALRVSRQLGNRFKSSSRAVSTTQGNLTLAGNQQHVTIVRRQTETGERVELLLGGRGLTWSDREGLRAVSGLPADTERLLVERLIVDTPDQFVLAQLRGASYFTIARSVRPADAEDNYTGPLWTLVRVDDSQRSGALRAISSWRIYYINSATGLIDRVVCEVNGQTIQADIVAWNEWNGEKIPSHITWSAGTEIIMDFQVTTLSLTE